MVGVSMLSDVQGETLKGSVDLLICELTSKKTSATVLLLTGVTVFAAAEILMPLKLSYCTNSSSCSTVEKADLAVTLPFKVFRTSDGRMCLSVECHIFRRLISPQVYETRRGLA